MTTPVRIGTKFQYIYADGRPTWTVKERRGGDTFNCVIEGDDFGGVTKVFGIEEIRAAINNSKLWDGLAKTSRDWFSTLTVGDIVHYHDGFDQFVRCEVVLGKDEITRTGPKKKLLQPIALVGAWKDYDLPRRLPDGTIEYRYHAEKVIYRSGAWQPHDSTVFESPSYSYKGWGDPREMPAIDLTVPEPDAVEVEKIRLENIRRKAVTLLSDYQVLRDADAETLKKIMSDAIGVLSLSKEA